MDTKAGDTKAGDRPFMRPNEDAHAGIGCAMRVHTAIGSGALESAVSLCMLHEMRGAALYVDDQPLITLTYRHIKVHGAYRADFIVEKCLIVEIKCVQILLPVHRSQLLTYLKATGLTLGLLLNFNVPHMRDGIHRVINGRESDLSTAPTMVSLCVLCSPLCSFVRREPSNRLHR